ncbi:CRISPR-associated DxTHG motif protein (plasmid) [Thiospirochaeta perfilievii]|uniref:CRISPR-associated DxTHG motif protein n=1 Tax=Thiospirochaeta perfilievii TaxID=252967 RepID=A0A5C1QGG3_9SPIO|nr:CRISPR-associated DxTHG motif protein [Thiospirochaeta perfilievii]
MIHGFNYLTILVYWLQTK